MSEAVLQQVKELINNLSGAEQAQLIEWLGAVWSQALTSLPVKAIKEDHTSYATQIDPDSVISTDSNGASHYNLGNHDLQTKRVARPPDEIQGDIPWEKRAWTETEIHAFMKPKSKTGAEIAAWLRANPDTGDWTEMDIPDVVEWVRQLRHQISTRWELGE